MIAFSDKQWQQVKDTYKLWWKGELNRPIIPLMFFGRDPGGPAPKNPLLAFDNVADFSITPKDIIRTQDYALSHYEFALDGYPIMGMSQFGPGVVAAFLGCELYSAKNTVWFHPKKVLPLKDLEFAYDPDNIWLNRIKDIYREGNKFWRGQVVMAMTDLGGILDILASFRTTDNLLFDLYDNPEDVKRCVRDIQKLWFRYFDEFNEILSENCNGYTDWGGAYCPEPGYMFQSDFSYMIGADTFKEFVCDELKTSSDRVNYGFYHLDGIGQLNHLDALLGMPGMKGIQWVPGEGAPSEEDWSDVYCKIGASGKKLQVYYNLEKEFDNVIPHLKSPGQLIKTPLAYGMNQRDEVFKKLASKIYLGSVKLT